jgi:hypothetical protein
VNRDRLLSASATFFVAERVFTAGFGDSGFVGVMGCADLCERLEEVPAAYGLALPLLFAFVTLDFGMVRWDGEIFCFDLCCNSLCLTRRENSKRCMRLG